MKGVHKALETSICCSKGIYLKIEIKLGDRRAGAFLERTWTLESVCMLCAPLLSCVQLFVTPWTIAHQAPLSAGFPNKNTGMGCHLLL